MTDFLKVGPAALDAVDNISAHEKIRILSLAEEIKDAIASGGLDPSNPACQISFTEHFSPLYESR